MLFKMKRQSYALVTIAPLVWLTVCTLTAGWQKLFDARPAVGFIAQARRFAAAAAEGKILAPAKTVEQMNQVIVNQWVDAGLTALFMVIVIGMLGFGLKAGYEALGNPKFSAKEVGDDLSGVRAQVS